jgi:hypothetical protein
VLCKKFTHTDQLFANPMDFVLFALHLCGKADYLFASLRNTLPQLRFLSLEGRSPCPKQSFFAPKQALDRGIGNTRSEFFREYDFVRPITLDLFPSLTCIELI